MEVNAAMEFLLDAVHTAYNLFFLKKIVAMRTMQKCSRPNQSGRPPNVIPYSSAHLPLSPTRIRLSVQ
jgi:hypothetical protein